MFRLDGTADPSGAEYFLIFRYFVDPERGLFPARPRPSAAAGLCPECRVERTGSDRRQLKFCGRTFIGRSVLFLGGNGGEFPVQDKV